MANRNDFQQVVQAKRKITALEIIGNIIIWGAPLFELLFVIIFNWNKLWQQSTGFHLQFWMIFVFIIMMFIYLKWGRRKIHEQYVADKSRGEKHNPLLVIGNTFLCLIPFALGILLLNVLQPLGEPVELFLIILLGFELVGRVLLIIDSFKEEEYY